MHSLQGQVGDDASAATLDAAARGQGLRTVFQPIVSLPDRSLIGYEALARWPDLPTGHDAPAVLRHARTRGNINDLERCLIDDAAAAARTAGLPTGAVLSLNSEANAKYARMQPNSVLANAATRYQVMFELTERDLFAHPAGLLRKVEAMRCDGFAIALDDVGGRPHSCALLDVIRPDVIKLDLALIQRDPTVDQAHVLSAVLAHRERTHAVILAEGIETDEHLDHALALGADLGQGYLFGRPSLAPPVAAFTRWQLPLAPPDWTYRTRTPFDLVADSVLLRTARKQTLVAFSRNIERLTAGTADHALVFTSVQRGRFFTGATRHTYQNLAASCPLVAVFGRDLPADVTGDLRLIELSHGDELADQWLVVALGGHAAAALIARERLDPVDADRDRRFDFVITHDRALITSAVRTLMARFP
jgi:EAL domain-containing protein (putative c-di-GMP-specific phosphodiesterase class I)